MPHNFFRKRACIEPATTANQAGRSRGRERRNGINGGSRERSVDGEEAVYAGFALLLTERRAVVFSRGASSGFAGWGFLLIA
jgi:hypothetical protein